MANRIFIPELIDEDSLGILRKVGEIKIGHGNYSEEELVQEIKEVDAIIITSQHRITKRIVNAARQLKIIAKYGSKPTSKNIDIEAVTKRKIPVIFAPGSNADTVAEHTICLMLALMKKLYFATAHLKSGKWRDGTVKTQELLGKTIGIIGLGEAGFKVIEKLKSFGVRILVYDPYVSKKRAKEVGVEPVNLETLLKESDVVSIHAGLTKETKGLIGERELKMMKRTAFIINTARGAIINEKALIKALKKGWISGAGLDVFEREPTDPDNPLLMMDNVVATPHIAGWSYESLKRSAFMVATDVARVLQGEEPVHAVNPEYKNKAQEGR